MLIVKELKPRIFEITLSGTVEASDIETMKRDLTPALEAEGKMGLVLRMEKLDDVTGDALIADTRFEMSMLPQWSKVARVAVVTDKQAFEALLNWFDPILPMIEFRTFAPGEASAAESWAADLPKTEAEGPGLRIVEDGSDGLLVFEIDGKLTEEAADRVFAAFDRAVEKHGKINLMVRVKDYEGFDLGLFGDRDFMTSKFGAIGKVGRYAVVGAPGWMRTMIASMGPLIPIEMRAFDMSEDTAARDWARAA
ncbi:MAG: STAS/SEC14 domain-containing protein [Pelagibaca sp.]